MSDQDQEIFEFPCEFPIKAMGHAHVDLHSTVLDIVQRHAPEARREHMEEKSSKNGKYLSLTITITATSRAQLDAIYMDLHDHDHIVMTL